MSDEFPQDGTPSERANSFWSNWFGEHPIPGPSVPNVQGGDGKVEDYTPQEYNGPRSVVSEDSGPKHLGGSSHNTSSQDDDKSDMLVAEDGWGNLPAPRTYGKKTPIQYATWNDGQEVNLVSKPKKEHNPVPLFISFLIVIAAVISCGFFLDFLRAVGALDPTEVVAVASPVPTYTPLLVAVAYEGKVEGNKMQSGPVWVEIPQATLPEMAVATPAPPPVVIGDDPDSVHKIAQVAAWIVMGVIAVGFFMFMLTH